MAPDTATFRIPVSTYRLQFHREFGFSNAKALVPYLAQLGVTDCYASPYLRARPGSPHGYDICDHNQLNPEIGSDEDYATFMAALAAHAMGQIVDFVPNHMGADEMANPWWRDVLENGPSSRFAGFFDIDWHPIKSELTAKVLLPILGDQYGAVLERGELHLVFEDGAFTLRYFDHNLPLNPRQFPKILDHELDMLRSALGGDDPHLLEYLSIATALRNLPVYTETEPGRMAERQREKEVARERLARLANSVARIREHIAAAVRAFNGTAGEPATFDRLHDVLEAQPYRLAHWRTAFHEINYRRFFDINALAGLRMEDPQVFAATHGLVLRLIREGTITGMRIDHIDGLFDPQQYLERLQHAAQAEPAAAGSGEAAAQALYIVTEKILSTGESLSEQWPVAGTSGYDFLNDVNGVFIDRRNHRALMRVYRRFTGVRVGFADIAYEGKKRIMDTSMASELNVLADALNRLSECDRRTRDFTLDSLRDALQEVVACFPIYRTYVTGAGFSQADHEAIETALRRARRRNPTMEPSIFDFLRDTLLPAADDKDHPLRLEFAMKFQQYTGPVQAKGVEDTACYRYNLLASLSAVGGNPGRFGCPPAEFHAANVHRHQRWPFTLLATSTHDTKRGEDVRARLNVLSELPDEWGRHLSVWAKINAASRSVVDGERAPDRNDEYLFYQTLLGVWPPDAASRHVQPDALVVTRVRDYMLKAAREAKVHTSWITQHQAYEAALTRFVDRVLTGPTAARFQTAFQPFQQRVADLGMVNSLSQLVLKVVSPGVPDFYQGTELWDLNLVDPDNRRPVDFAVRQRLLNEMEPVLSASTDQATKQIAAVIEMLRHWEDGRIKLFLSATALRLRRRLSGLFLAGNYEPLESEGEHSEHVIALARRQQHDVLIAVVPRLVVPLMAPGRLPVGAESWGDTRLLLPAELCNGVYRNVLTHERLRPALTDGSGHLPLASILQVCPVALLLGGER